jgi:hypothetical protein
LLRTLPGSATAFLRQFPLTAVAERYGLDFLMTGEPVLFVRTSLRGGEWEPVLAVYDNHYRKRLELAARRADGYRRRGVVEWPAAGLRVLRVWREETDGLREVEVTDE